MLSSAFQFPYFSDTLSAGFPSAAEGYEDEPLNLHDYLVRNPPATFFYRLRGDGLLHEHLRDGAILVIDRSIRPTPGKLVLIECDTGFSVCRFKACQSGVVHGVVVAGVTRY